MAFNFFRRGRSATEDALGERLPPGQYATEKWPVLHYGAVPKFDQASWDFRISGLVEEPVRLTYDEFMALPRKTVTRDVHCVTRWSMFDSEWEGVPFLEAVKLVKVQPEAQVVIVHAENNYTTNLPLPDVMRDDVLFVYRRNGEDIAREHGWPLRLFVPHLYFWKSAKWVRGLEFVAQDRPGFWEGYGYHMRGDPWNEERYDWQ
ncbi:MAG: sulfite oxidase-like oxidoreductase [Chloroflexi bacterium]|nr:sulfite oxidase-like oxidoreductase [Chloroflexota bacterium]